MAHTSRRKAKIMSFTTTLIFILASWEEILGLFAGMAMICIALIGFGALLTRWLK